MKTQNKVLKSFIKIHKTIHSKTSYPEIADAFKNELAPEIKYLKSYLNVKKEEEIAVITLLVIESISSSEPSLSYEAMRTKLKLTDDLEEWLNYIQMIKCLCKKNIIETGYSEYYTENFFQKENALKISALRLKAIMENKTFNYYLKKEKVVLKTAMDVVFHIYNKINKLLEETDEYRYKSRRRNSTSAMSEINNPEIAKQETINHVLKILNKKSKLPYINFLLNLFKKGDKDELLIYLHMVGEYISGNTPTNISQYFDILGYSEVKGIVFIKELKNKENILTKYQLIEPYHDEEKFLDMKRKEYFYVMSEQSVQNMYQYHLLDESVKIKTQRTFHGDKFIAHTSISPVELIYSENNKKQLNQLINSLTKEKLKEIQERMKAYNYPTGINILFYGYPGTGKTESVKQIARMTQRDILWVDVAELKSVWYGQTEKNIRELFKRYRDYCNEAGNAPILLLNEADAIISKRQQVFNPIGQIENTIQNILLEEMETHIGILMATTNLLVNFDPAFERRFLFKIEFEKPNARIRAKIWKNKLQFLSERDCEELAQEFEFTGGQIDNICKKAIIDEIITGQKINFFQILQYCYEERWNADKGLI